MSLRLVDRYHPQRRRQQQAEIDAGHIRKVDELALLEEDQLRPLALLSLIMLIVGGLFFGILELLAYRWHYAHWIAPLSPWGSILWLVINIIGYIIILPLHEGIHGLTIALWGGRAHFGARLPLALYCGARQQLFPRNYYLVIALAPLVVISLACILVIVLSPGLAAYGLLAMIGNFSGAAGDVMATRRLFRLSPRTFIEDTEVGYTAWELSMPPGGSESVLRHTN